MNIKELIKKFKRKELNKLDSKKKETGNVIFETIYQDNNIENIYNIFINDGTNLNYQDKANQILELMENDPQLRVNIEECSLFTNVYIIDDKLTEDLFNILLYKFNGYRNVVRNTKDKVFYLLISGSIKDYKDLIRYSDIDNLIIHSVIQSLYQTNSIYFKDMKDILDLNLFVDDDNIEFKYKKKNISSYGTIYTITPIRELENILQEFKFTERDIINIGNVIYKSEFDMYYNKVNIIDLFNYYNDRFSIIIKNEIKNMKRNIERCITPIYKNIETDNSGYDEIDEPIDDNITTVYEKKSELIYEDDNGEVCYDPKYFL